MCLGFKKMYFSFFEDYIGSFDLCRDSRSPDGRKKKKKKKKDDREKEK